ncbi:hypothetical protein IHN63_00585 [Deinococcus sp. 6YEL10]|uniref:hypothetical protein n=1 Tax=Deinococcus sp. 6YEL10 TaxID=2745870 RepID=UPI001E5E2C3F|nr:hypothetical protein [Deinococcus sp. 6YEL10]MCD0159796.1 hypothetical protein [Deinococcus sp. 6YEL10]
MSLSDYLQHYYDTDDVQQLPVEDGHVSIGQERYRVRVGGVRVLQVRPSALVRSRFPQMPEQATLIVRYARGSTVANALALGWIAPA